MKFVREFCAICHQVQAMPVVQEDETYAGLIWVRCPTCQEIKPIEAAGASPTEAPGPGPSPGVKGRGVPEAGEVGRRVVRNYRAGERFAPGEWIYHPGWDDTGQVMEKCRSKGGHDIIVVSFAKMGTRRLISNFAN